MEGQATQDTGALRQHIRRAPGESLYGIVDGAQDLELAYEAKIHYGREIRSLFQGSMGPALADVAPYLVPIDADSGYLENWIRRRGSNAGILVVTAADLDALHAHLREIFIVEDEDDQEYFFRYYDPRVLRSYLPTCTVAELDEFFGPLRSVVVEYEGADGYVAYTRTSTGLATSASEANEPV